MASSSGLIWSSSAASRTPAVFAASYELSSKMSHPPNTTSSSDASGTKSLICGESSFGALAEPHRAHLRERSDRFGEPAPDGEHAGDRGRADGPHAHEQNPEFPCRFCDFRRILHNGRLYHPHETQPAATGRARPCNSSVAAAAIMSPMRWFRKPVGDPLTVSMAGLKLGDRLLFLGSVRHRARRRARRQGRPDRARVPGR